MRILALTILAVATLAAAAPASAQTYAPGYPVCMQVWGPINYYDCSFTSLPQCNLSASGRPAQCVVILTWPVPSHWRRAIGTIVITTTSPIHQPFR